MNSRELLRSVVCAACLWPASSALALADAAPGDWPAGSGDLLPPSAAQPAADPSPSAGCGGPVFAPPQPARWTASAELVLFDRIGGLSQPLVETAPGSVPVEQLYDYPCDVALTAADFHQGFYAGPRLGLIRHGDSGCDLELSYFQIDGWSSARSVGPDNPKDEYLVMKAPNGFLQIQDGDQSMRWTYATQLCNAELNARWNPSAGVTLLAGFRWLQLRENLQGVLEPPTFSWEPPFWNTATDNNLYGLQIGAGAKVFQQGRLSIAALMKSGVYDDNAQQSTGVSIIKHAFPSSAATNHAAFVGQSGLEGRYQVTPRLTAKAGYEALWLEGVALAPGQIQETYSTLKPITVTALGVNCNSGVFFHGATAGLEYAF